ncbi:hypothetical protein L6164_003261 [Bauhinia variegata]|uniref:Uncharacterized protein n=1 Tax=Bauhinia variegata TaxID=167791 RepID=A0ACB9Q0S3_BAUVA|nr:hypothetical protein L6164_003261 [Bauhinia variegata]
MEKNTVENKDNIGSEGEGGEEQISDSFVCCVCLDLIYKPIVLSCGHISCFWCVYKSMNGLRESRCPICRHPYYHFPTICQMLHFLLLKLYPVAYTRRENQTLEEEKKSGDYSPQFDADACGSLAKYLYPGSSSSCSIITSESNSCPTSLSSSSMETSVHEQSESASHEHDKDTVDCEHTSDGTIVAVGTLSPSVKGKKFPQNEQHGQQKISVADLMCTACKQLLFNPIVLNCGHVYCESCIISSADKVLRCQVCQTPHPRGCPKVCLELVHFLEEQLPEEYARRRDAVQLRQINVQPEYPSSRLLDKGREGENVACRSDPRLNVHVGVGCDFCGMYPVIGDRYKCKDCKERVGFDLCSNCYNSRLKLPGRFNQQHTSEHKFELIKTNIIHNIMLRLGNGQSVEASSDHIALDNLEMIYEEPSLFGDGEDDQHGSGAPHQNI